MNEYEKSMFFEIMFIYSQIILRMDEEQTVFKMWWSDHCNNGQFSIQFL